MPKGYRPYFPDQDLLLPPSLRDWLPEDHLVYFVSDVVDQLDLSAIHAWYGEEKRGQPPYDPVLMTKLLVYGYCTGVFSSRRLQKRIQEDIPFKVLAAGNEPDFRTISDFRKIHLAALEELFEQVLELALESGSVKLGRVSLDGTKVKANASKHKAMSYGRAKEKQQQLRQEVKELLAQAAAADEEEDRRHGNRRGDELPDELRRRETRLAKIKQAKKAIEQRAREKAAAEGKSTTEIQQAKPGDKDQYNFTDPESRIMKSVRAGLQCPGGGGGGVGCHRGAVGDASRQRQRTTAADGGSDRAAIGAAAVGHSGRQRFGLPPRRLPGSMGSSGPPGFYGWNTAADHGAPSESDDVLGTGAAPGTFRARLVGVPDLVGGTPGQDAHSVESVGAPDLASLSRVLWESA
jgi:transposase